MVGPRRALLLSDLVLVPLSSHTTARPPPKHFDRKPDLNSRQALSEPRRRPQRRYETVAPANSLK
jgi:hypothetical protein